jgi:dienelactone hydrolase
MSKQAKLIIWFLALSLLPTFARAFIIQEANLATAPDTSQPNSVIKVELPAPTGPLAVGRIAYHWTDSSRGEPFATTPGAYREVMVYIWYPANAQPNAPTLPYLQSFASLEKCAGETEMKNLLGAAYVSVKSGELRTHAAQDANISTSSKQYPLLVFSPGFGEYSLTYSAMLEDLASHGYVVAAIDHPYDGACVVFPDGRSIAFAQEKWDAAKKQLDSMMAYYGSRIEVWAADTRFALNQLTRYNKMLSLKAPFAGRLDLQRIGVFGHSVGGMTAFRAGELDNRFRAIMNQDSDYQGKPFMPNSSAKNIKQPFLFFVSQHSFYKHVPALTDEQLKAEKLTRAEFNKLMDEYDKNQEDALANMSGGSYRVAVETPLFTHRSFIDTALFKVRDDPTKMAQSLKNLEIVRAYTRAFFDKHLKSMKKTLLDETTAHDSGVSVNQYKGTNK